MHSPSMNSCRATSSFIHSNRAFYHSSSSASSFSSVASCKFNCYPSISCSFGRKNRGLGNDNHGSRERVKMKQGKENVWSVDNEMAKAEEEKAKIKRKKGKRGGRVKNVVKRKRIGDGFMVSGAMLVEVETVLQTQEPVIRPAWQTFTSSVSGIWKGVGAVFSPITAEMEPIEIGNKNENLFDCYTVSHVEVVPSPSGGQTTQINRRINWVPLNPFGEVQQEKGNENRQNEKSEDGKSSLSRKETFSRNYNLPKFESFNFERSDVMEEDVMTMEPGLVFFEDGSYSRGPVDIRVGEYDESNYFISPTYKFEQCLVKGCHKRLRIVHTIEFGNEGSDIQIMRVAVYEEQWDSPASIPYQRVFLCLSPPDIVAIKSENLFGGSAR